MTRGRIARHLNAVRVCVFSKPACAMPWNHRRRCRRPFQTRVLLRLVPAEKSLRRVPSFFAKSKRRGGAGIREMIKRRASKRGRGGVRPSEPVTRRPPPPLPLKLAPGLEVTNIMDGGGGACFLCIGCGQIEHSSNLSAGRRRREMEAAMQRDFTPQKAPRLLF